jgi:TRAP-type C4-dicarboxylate transport system permease small subunit
METGPQSGPRPDESDAPLIVMEEEEIVIEHHFEDWLAFAVFWVLGIVVFAQFFTRYVLNDSLAWTEEIARYLLMWVTFIGAAIVTRRRTHIAVEMLEYFLPERPASILRAVIDIVTVGFLGCLAWFSFTIIERMQIQRMTIIDMPMSVVYGGVAFGVFLMLFRAAQVFWRNMRGGWRRTAPEHTLLID